MGGKSKSSSQVANTTHTTNTSGVSSVDGDNYGANIAGLSNSSVNLTLTDHGAIMAAKAAADQSFALGSKAVESISATSNSAIMANANLSKVALDNNSANTRYALESNANLSKVAFDNNARLADSSLSAQTQLSESAINTIKGLAAQQTATTKDALAIARDVKAREQTGTNQDDNKTKKVLFVVIGLTLITVIILMNKKGK